MPRLDFYASFKLVVKVRLRNPQILIGRGPDCDIQLPDEQVSRHHAQILEKDGAYWIENLSPNGTRVNSALVNGPQPLSPGDRVYVESCVLVYQPDDAPSEELSRSRTMLKVPVLKIPPKTTPQNPL
jgi:hypothetical protein